MFAVIKTGGKQYRVAVDDLIEVDRIDAETGASVEFAEVLALGGDSPVVGTPTVGGASVAAEVLEQGRKPTVIAFKKRRRKNSRRKRGHRQQFTLVKITEILSGATKDRKAAAAQPADMTQTSAATPEKGAAAAAPATAVKPGESEKTGGGTITSPADATTEDKAD